MTHPTNSAADLSECRAVHPFASDIHTLDCELRREADPVKRSILMASIQHLKNGTDRPNGKRFIGRQMRVADGTYKPPGPKWLSRKPHLDADQEPEIQR